MSSTVSPRLYSAQIVGNWPGPSFTEPPRSACRKARSYCISTSLRTTVSSIGTERSAAVAARSAGCSKARGEMSFSFWDSGRGLIGLREVEHESEHRVQGEQL